MPADRLALLEGLLKKFEWRQAYYGTEYVTVCTWCGCRKETGHAPGCTLAVALGSVTRDERKYPERK